MAGGREKERDLFNALGHPLRRALLREMLDCGGEVSPRELALGLYAELSTLSYHVRLLAECGAIRLVRTEQVHGSTQHFYRAAVKAEWVLLALDAEVKTSGRPRRPRRE